MRSSSSITSKPATASSTKIRTATTSAGQRRANILGLSSTTSAGGVAGSSGVSSGRPVLTRYSSSTNSGVSASSPRRPSGSQATGSTSLSRSSSGPSSSSGHKHSGTVSTSINTSSMRHSFESSLRSYSASSSSSTSSATTDTASAFVRVDLL
ncbi:uncharacterized serine-rich protein C215.13-like [Pomacea canaliculata]|uniref:uncharacterized serine-rich protein C215.13-like n=1 Tax=Pomacea canaliculata TaxID=400727 RepID=UPI000D7369E4|nr:uncharacterized serine-rich protein C215.13-like [Pomacea canaliculata]